MVSQSFLDKELAYVTELVNLAAYRVARKFKDYVSRDDVSQEIWAWVYAHTTRVDGHALEHADNRKRLEDTLMLDFNGVAEKYCRAEKARAAGYHVEDEYYYTPETIARLLILALDPDSDLSPAKSADEVKSKQLANEGNSVATMVADIRSTLKDLHQDKAEIVYLYYGEGWRDSEIADEYGLTTATVTGRRGAALRFIRRRLGGRRPYAAA